MNRERFVAGLVAFCLYLMVVSVAVSAALWFH